MAQVPVRNLDEQVVMAAPRLTADERVALARRIRGLTPANVRQIDSAELIRQDRNGKAIPPASARKQLATQTPPVTLIPPWDWFRHQPC
jgi:hypothetical protein